jgi:hypothetical protein
MVINFTIFFIFSFAFVFSIISTNWFVLLDKAYGHGLSRDESLPFEISGKQIAIEGILEPPFLNEGNQKLTFIVRTHDEKTNETIKDINYRIIAKFKKETIMDQRFHALDGIMSANFIRYFCYIVKVKFVVSNKYKYYWRFKAIMSLWQIPLTIVSQTKSE